MPHFTTARRGLFAYAVAGPSGATPPVEPPETSSVTFAGGTPAGPISHEYIAIASLTALCRSPPSTFG